MKRKVVYNRCGGFGLSNEAWVLYYKYRYPEKNLYFYLSIPKVGKISITLEEAIADPLSVEVLDKDFGPKVSTPDLDSYYEHVVKPGLFEIKRHDPILVRVVEELGSERASCMWSSLAIADIGDSLYRIEEGEKGREKIITPETPFEWM